MKYRIVIAIIIIIAFLIAGLIIYANNVLLPTKLKAKITRELEKSLGKNVQIERLHYNLFKGFIVENLSIFDGAKEKPYLSVKEISFQFLLFPLFEKRIIIPLAHIDSPQLYLTLRQDNTLNIMDVFKKFPQKEKKARFSLFIYKLNISNGKCQFKDEHTSPSYIKEATDLKIGAQVDIPGKIKFILQGKVLNQQNTPSFFSASGEYNLVKQELESKVKLANLIVNDYLLYLKIIPLSIAKGIVDNADFEITFQNHQLSSKGLLFCKNIELRKEKFLLAGDMEIKSDIKYNFADKALKYAFICGLSKMNFSGLDYLKDSALLKGSVGFQNDRIWTSDLKAQVLGSSFDIKGSLENFADPSLKVNISSSQINLEKITALLPDALKNLNLSGNSSLNLNLKGSLKQLPLQLGAVAQITSGKMQLAFIKEPLEDVRGVLNFTNDQLKWENFLFLYRQSEYNTSGSITDFKQPEVDFSLNSKDLTSTTFLNIKDKMIKIKECSLKLPDSELAIKGTINIEAPQTPLFNLTLESNISLKDTFRFLPANISENLKKIKVDGLCKVNGSLNGNAKEMKSWNAQLRLSSDTLSLYDLKLNNLYFTLQQKDGLINTDDLSANLYSGNLALQFGLNLLGNVPNYTAKLGLSDVDLAKLKMDTKLKDKDISGLLNMRLNLQGNTAGLAALRGDGTISVREGKLWELNLFKGLGEFLFLPIYHKIVFRDVTANFLVRNSAIEIADSFLSSEELELSGTGKLQFDGSLDLALNSQINEDLLKDSPDLRKITSAVLGNLLVIKISGTIQKPEYKIVPGTKEIINQIKRFFFGK